MELPCPVQSVHSGHYFTVARVDRDDYYCWGSLKESQAANEDAVVVEPSIRMKFSERGILEDVAQLYCSRFHSVAVTCMKFSVLLFYIT